MKERRGTNKDNTNSTYKTTDGQKEQQHENCLGTVSRKTTGVGDGEGEWGYVVIYILSYTYD